MAVFLLISRSCLLKVSNLISTALSIRKNGKHLNVKRYLLKYLKFISESRDQFQSFKKPSSMS